MSLSHRTEMLDAIMADINWKKMLRLIPSISKDWKNARMQLSSAKEDFELLDKTATVEQTEKWQEQLNAAQEARIHDVTAMDVLNAKISKPPSFSKVRTRLMDAEKRAGQDVGLTSWIAFGFKIQEAQIRLKSYLRTLPKERTDPQEVEVSRRREQLYTDINSLYEMATSLFPDCDLSSLKYDEPPGEDVQLEDEDDTVAADDNPYSLSHNDIENVKLPLPSSLTPSDMTPSLRRAKEKELTLRVAQAEDTLENIRNDIGHKSYLYRSNIRLAEGKKQKTRGYATVNAINRSLRDHIRIYGQARWAMHRLGADDDTKLRYRPIRKEDTRAVTAIYQPNARGERNKPLSWIWSMDVQGDSQSSEYLEELYRVNWLRARSRLDRWEEEFTLLNSEMEWVLNFFAFKEDECKAWANLKKDSPGHVALARKQGEMWRLMYAQAEVKFNKVRSGGL